MLVKVLLIIHLSAQVLAFSMKRESSFDDMAQNMANQFKAPILKINSLQSLSNYIILDARENEEFKVSHLQGAISIGYNDFDLKKIKKHLTSDKKILVYCSVGYRSGDITKRLKDKGYDAYNLYGGIFHWVNEGREVFSLKKKTQKIHGYNKDWSKWLKRGEVLY